MVLVPSAALKATIEKHYKIANEKIIVVPNSLSDGIETIDRRGRFATKHIIFVGRLSYQKAPELFVELADAVRAELDDATFAMFGAGDMQEEIAALIDKRHRVGTLTISSRSALWDRLRDTVDWSKAAIARIDRKTGATQLIGKGEQPAFLLDQSRSVVEVTPIQGFPEYNCRIQAKGEAHSYLVNWPGIPSFGVDKFVELKGFVEWPDRAVMFDKASALIVPSRSEPFGMVILEAMQHGVPVFFTESAGAGEVLQAGTPINPDDYQATSKAICTVLKDEELWNKIVEEQRESVKVYVESKYHIKIKQLYDRLTAELRI